MPDIKALSEDLKRTRDEIGLKIHLGSKDLQDKWSDLETQWRSFQTRAELQGSAKEVSAAVQLLGAELKEAFDRVRKAL